ncbi:MAG: hypothetical protein NTV86_23865 [Planctomycetota bacterium]|nr:hypothetical protein [Planctomycetota bacterium]
MVVGPEGHRNVVLGDDLGDVLPGLSDGVGLGVGQEAHPHQSPGGLLGGLGEERDGVVLAVLLLVAAGDLDLQQPVLQAEGLQLGEPRADDVAAGGDDILDDRLPQRTVHHGHPSLSFPARSPRAETNEPIAKTALATDVRAARPSVVVFRSLEHPDRRATTPGV